MLLVAQLWGFCRPGRHCCFVLVGAEAVAGALITLTTVEVARHYRGRRLREKGWREHEVGIERRQDGIDEVYFFIEIFGLVVWGLKRASGNAHSDLSNKEIYCFPLDSDICIGFISATVTFCPFASFVCIFPPSFQLHLAFTHEPKQYFFQKSNGLQVCLLARTQEVNIR